MKGCDFLNDDALYIDMIHEEELPKQGYSKPITITASDGKKYILKNDMVMYPTETKPSKQDAEFFQEALVSEIAKKLAVPTPNYATITIDVDTLSNFPDLQWKYKFSMGKYFATEKLPNIGNDLLEVFKLATDHSQPYAIRGWRALFNNVVNKEIIPNLICLDFLTLNLDRFTNGGNLLFQYQNNGKWLVSIDYGFCFFSPYWNTDPVSQRKIDLLNFNNPKVNPDITTSYSATMMFWFLSRSKQMQQASKFKYGVVFDALQRELDFSSNNPFSDVVAEIESLTNTFFVNTISNITPDWISGGNMQKQAYVDFLNRQKSLIKPFIEYNIAQNIFTNYKGEQIEWHKGKSTNSQ